MGVCSSSAPTDRVCQRARAPLSCRDHASTRCMSIMLCSFVPSGFYLSLRLPWDDTSVAATVLRQDIEVAQSIGLSDVSECNARTSLLESAPICQELKLRRERCQ